MGEIKSLQKVLHFSRTEFYRLHSHNPQYNDTLVVYTWLSLLNSPCQIHNLLPQLKQIRIRINIERLSYWAWNSFPLPVTVNTFSARTLLKSSYCTENISDALNWKKKQKKHKAFILGQFLLSEVKMVRMFWQVNKCNMLKALGKHGLRSGDIARLPPMWHTRTLADVVVGSLLAPRVFFKVLHFPFRHKSQHRKFKFDQDSGPVWEPPRAVTWLPFYIL